MKIMMKYLKKVLIIGLLGSCSNVFASISSSANPDEQLPLTIFDDAAITRKAERSETYTLETTSPVVNDELIFRFFEDTVYTMRVTRVESGYDNAVIIEATDSKTPASLLRQVITPNGIRTELNDKERGFLYQALPRSDGKLQILEYDKSKGGVVTPTNPLSVPGEIGTLNLGIDSLSIEGSAETLSTSTEIDVMIVFDQTAQAWAAANGGITAFANATISKMNTAHALSGTECSFRLVHVHLSDYTYDSSTSSLSDELQDIFYERNGFSDVSDIRDSVGADLAAALVDTGSAYGSTGIGYMPGGPSGSSSAAYTVCSIRAVNNGHTLTHEMGHNLGCGHSKDMSTQPGPGIFSYAAGWYFRGSNGTDYHTIMSYNYNNGDYYSSCGLFSSPTVTFQGVAVGDATDGDNARCIREMKDVIAAYRVSTVSTISPPVISPASGTSFSSTLQVSMSCSTSGSEIRYTIDGSEPTGTSTLYTGAITISSTTTFKAAGFKEGMDPSSVTTAVYSKFAENDDFSNAESITETMNSTWGNNINCTRESGEPSHVYTADASAWWKWTAPKSGEVTFSTYGSPIDTTMAAYTGGSLTSLTKLDSNDDSGGTYQSEITFAVTAGTDYYIAVDGYAGEEGLITLNWNLEYLEVGTCSIIDDSGSKAFRMQFNAKAGETYKVQCKGSLSASEPWADCDPPLTLTAGSDGTYNFDIGIPEGGGKQFFKIVRQ